MMRLTEEQKAILNCYKGGRTKILHELRVGAEEIRVTGEDAEMLEMLEDLIGQLATCTNKEFFQMKRECLFDLEKEETTISEEVES